MESQNDASEAGTEPADSHEARTIFINQVQPKRFCNNSIRWDTCMAMFVLMYPQGW